LPEKEPLIRFQLPEVGEVKAYAVKTEDGKILVRTEEELQQLPLKQEKKE